MPTKKHQLIAPSILSADMARLADEVARIEAGGADWVHVDVMDGRFVPNITIGIPVVEAMRKHTRMPLDVHLMIVEPERYVERFARAGATWVTVHAEATYHLHGTLRAIRQAGARPAVALNPATSLSAVEHVLDEVDMVLIMTVEPGFGGQRFLPAMIDKVERLHQLLQKRKLSVDIQVDGGVNMETIRSTARAGANVFVAGNSIFGESDVGEAIQKLRQGLKQKKHR